MKILLIGGSGSLINRLIVRLNKEDQRVFLLTGSRFRNETYERVFERYDFPYSTEQISEIFESINPDVTIFTGAFDTGYDWSRQESRVCVEYLSDLVNLLMAYAMRRHGRFLYLSSEDVFTSGERITEDKKPDSTDYRGMTLSQAEEICENYRKNQKLDVVTLRVGGMYHCPESLKDADGPVEKMCLDAFAHKRVSYHPHRMLAPLNEQDAVQFILEATFAETCEHALYHISGDVTLSEHDLADMVTEEERELSTDENVMAAALDRENSSQPFSSGMILDSSRFRNEFGMNRFLDLKEGIRQILKFMSDHPEVFLDDKERKKTFGERIRESTRWFLKALIPVLENLVVFIPVFLLSSHASGSRYFARIDFYLLYVLLFAVVHGQQQAVLSAILSTAGYIFLQAQRRSGLDVLVDYNTYIWLAQLFIVGLVVGYLRDRITKLEEESAEDHSYMARQVSDIQDINESNMRVKDALETQVISQHDSVGKVYEIVSRLDQYSSDEVLFYAARVIGELMHTRDVAIYTSTRGAYARLFTATTKTARSLGNSIQLQKLGDVYDALKDHKVFINRSLNRNLPMMACAIYETAGDEERIETVVMVWGLSWERVTLSEADLLAVICALIQNAVSRASRYLKAIEDSRFIKGTSLMNKDAFLDLVRTHTKAQDSGLTQATLVQIKWDQHDLPAVSKLLRSTVRDTDYIGLLQNGEVGVLLTNTDAAGAAVAMNRMKIRGMEPEVVNMPDLEPETEEKHGLAGGIVAGGRA